MQNSTEKYLIGRQPILDRNQELFAYELLFRSTKSLNKAEINDATQASASVIVNTLSDFGLQQIIGQHLGFINLDLDLLMSDVLEILPKDQVVLELLENMEVTPQLIARCRELKEAGFFLALDDHQFAPEYEELYQLVDLVKVDLMLTPADSLASVLAHYRTYSFKLLAEKVETLQEFNQCMELGFDFFQGYYFARPALIEKKKVDESSTTLLRLMRLLSDDVEITEIEKTFRSSPGLTYKLLLLVNSVSLLGLQKIQSVRHAITMLGRTQMKRWVQLTLFAASSGSAADNPLVDMAAVRGGLMEHLVLQCPQTKDRYEAPEQAFMVGILSLLETLYDISMDSIASELNLSEEVQLGLIKREGVYGKMLSLAIALEHMDFSLAVDLLDDLQIDHHILIEAQMSAYNWQNQANV